MLFRKLQIPPFIFLVICMTHMNICIVASTNENPMPPLLVTRLIHQYRSIYSPYYDPKRTIQELAEIDLRSSIFRASSYNWFPLTDIESELSPSNEKNGFLVPLEVGEERIKQLVYMDTGSSMLWVNCQPCSSEVRKPIYNPKESSTYEPSDCELSDYCDAIGIAQVYCDLEHRCGFQVRYATGWSRGHLAKETFIFPSTRESALYGRTEEVVQDVVFGCSHKNSIEGTNGVLGLATNRLSLLKQRNSSKFSYCLGRVNDIFYAYNTLIIGDQVKLMKNQTPLIDQGKHYLSLTSIKIGETTLDIDREILKRNRENYSGGIVVDTASTLGFLPRVAYDVFELQVMIVVSNDVDLDMNPNYNYTFGDNNQFTRLCYNGVLYRDLREFPTVEYEFEEGARMTFGAESIFQQVKEDVVCLALLPSEIYGIPSSILGILMQQNYYVAYDLKAMKFSFQGMDCSTVDDYIHDEL